MKINNWSNWRWCFTIANPGWQDYNIIIFIFPPSPSQKGDNVSFIQWWFDLHLLLLLPSIEHWLQKKCWSAHWCQNNSKQTYLIEYLGWWWKSFLGLFQSGDGWQMWEFSQGERFAKFGRNLQHQMWNSLSPLINKTHPICVTNKKQQ